MRRLTHLRAVTWPRRAPLRYPFLTSQHQQPHQLIIRRRSPGRDGSEPLRIGCEYRLSTIRMARFDSFDLPSSDRFKKRTRVQLKIHRHRAAAGDWIMERVRSLVTQTTRRFISAKQAPCILQHVLSSYAEIVTSSSIPDRFRDSRSLIIHAADEMQLYGATFEMRCTEVALDVWKRIIAENCA